MRESIIERHLVKRMKAIGGEAYKWVSPSHIGVPDRICVFPSGVIVFVEVKAPGEQATVRQSREHYRLNQLKQFVEIIDNVFKVRDFINKYHE